MDKDHVSDILGYMRDDIREILRTQRVSCDRLTKLEADVSNHLEISEKNSISKKEKIYFSLGIIGSYVVGLASTGQL